MSTTYFDADCDLEPSLKSLFYLKTLKWIFVGGKGGVGKTTTSCSIAARLAEERESVLILSTDPAHNLSDAFVQKFSNIPTLVNGYKNLYAMELDASYQQAVEFKLKEENSLFSKFLPDLVSALPGIDEALGFATLMQSVKSMSYSVIVFDTAPTGHTLRLLSFPSLLEKGLSKLFSIKQNMSGALQIINSFSGNAIEEETLNSKLEDLKAITTSVKETFQDPSKTTFVCVCIPEFLSVYETERLIQELAKQSISCSHLVVNQVMFPIDLPSEGVQGNSLLKTPPELLKLEDIPSNHSELVEFTKKIVQNYNQLLSYSKSLYSKYYSKRNMQLKYLEQIRDLYSYDFHVAYIPTLNNEVRGIELLRYFGSLLSEVSNVEKLLRIEDDFPKFG
ncbi:arsenical pump-driving ATPase [Cryptosporidium ubiquitum]|uniref:ATPase ASNA1 homolog n=1 Tax=Cryptosporidium ubiquitum TaxID=857276 RepID=A0A1J4ML48_9CRYT|nr:arsenical pump-driving ATPase [Cryptosporidium ubiquitum]OII74969.1 arsenical pump-driving ATPase [Cryptosporidium ubiquitum]